MRRRKLATIEGEPASAVSNEATVLVGRVRAVTGVDSGWIGADPIYDIDVYGQDGVRTVVGVRPSNRNEIDVSLEPCDIKAARPGRRVLVIVDGDEMEFWIVEHYATGPCEEP